MIENQQFAQMSQQKTDEFEIAKLSEISAVKLNENLPPEQGKNPYCFLCGDTLVRICFTDSAPSLNKLLADYFLHLK